MYEMKFKELHDTIKSQLIKEYGQSFLNMSKHHQCAMITHRFIDILQEYRERQD